MSNLTVAADLIHVDPSTLVIGANVRTDTHPDAKQFAASIKARGVLEVITAYRDEAGALVVLRGQRRTVVATEVGTPTGTVPVRVVDAPDEADRITDQLVENLHREAMHSAEVVAGVEQLALLGVSAAQIARRTALKRPDVDAAIVVGGSESAKQRVSEGLSLEDAAIFAEFDGDEAALEELERRARWGHPLTHTAQRLRDAAADRESLRAEAERLRAEGVPALDPESVPADADRLTLDSMVDAEGRDVPEESWPSVTGVAVVVGLDWEYPEPTSDDEADEAEPDAVRVFTTEWIVTDPEAAGLRPRWQTATTTGGESEPTEDEREAQRAERRRVVEGNKAWRSAETVRREWLATFFARKSAPTGAEALICEAVLTQPWVLGTALQHRHRRLLDLLGEEVTGHYGSMEACGRLAARATSAKAHTMQTLAAVVAAWEDSTSVQTWRSPGGWDARVMAALIGWGYKASDIERGLVEEETSADAA